MMKKKQLALLTAVLLVVVTLAFVFRNQKPDTPTIAIATLMSHPALDAVQENLISELEQHGYTEGKTINYIVRNASGQVQLAAGIASELAAQDIDVIVAITTPMAQAVVKQATGPVVFAAVTDPVGAGIISSLDDGTYNITGTSDAWPYEDQLKLIRQITPSTKTLGVLYNPGEAASQYGIKEIKKYAPQHGFEIIEGAVNSTNEVYPVAQNLASRVDALFLSSDNTVIGGVAAAVKVAIEEKTPLYVGDSGTVEKGGLAAVSVGYAELGKDTGRLVLKFLEGKNNIPPIVAKDTEVYLNLKAAELMGVSIPDDVLNKATKAYQEIKE